MATAERRIREARCRMLSRPFCILTFALCLLSFSSATVLPLLKVGQGPRASAMGEAFTGVADDASAVYWNPAGLGQRPGYQLALSHHQWFTGITDEVLHAAVPLGAGAAGFGLVYSADRDIQSWDEQNQPGELFNTWDAALTAGYGLPIAGAYRLGAALTGACEDLHEAQGWGGALDIGALGRPLPQLGIGLAARHLGVMTFGAEPEWLPVEFAAGAGYFTGPLGATFDLVMPLDNNLNARLGLEYSPMRELALRVGYRTGPADLARLGYLSGLTAGFGVTVSDFGVDYTFTPYGKLGIAHRLGIRAALGAKQTPDSGIVTIFVTDADTKTPLAATIACSGVRDSVVVASELKMTGLRPGRLIVTLARSEYFPAADTFGVAGDRTQGFVMSIGRIKYGELRGGIYDAGTRTPIGGRVVYRGPAYGEQVAGADSGAFRVRSIAVGEYRLGISGPSEDYLPQACTVQVRPGIATERSFYLVKKRQTIVLKGVNFESGKAEVLEKFMPILDSAGTILKQMVDVKVEMAGHTDPREINTREFPSNWELSQARAEAVRKYLIEKFNINPERLTARGYADTQPIASNDSEEGMAKNRRTEFRVVEKE